MTTIFQKILNNVVRCVFKIKLLNSILVFFFYLVGVLDCDCERRLKVAQEDEGVEKTTVLETSVESDKSYGNQQVKHSRLFPYSIKRIQVASSEAKSFESSPRNSSSFVACRFIWKGMPFKNGKNIVRFSIPNVYILSLRVVFGGKK